MKNPLPWALLVVPSVCGVLLGLSIFWNLESRAANRERIAAMRDSLHIADSISTILNHRVDSVRLVADTLQAKLSASRSRLLAYSIQNVALGATLDSLIQTVSDSQTSLQIGTAVAELRGEIELCHSTLGICDSLNGVLRNENGVLIELSRRNSATITTLRAAWEAAERRTKQSNFGIGATCGFASTPAGSGLGCAVGITYRVRFAWPF